MPSVGSLEILVILMAVILFGPKRIPEIARTIGSTLNELRRASDELMRELTRETNIDRPTAAKKPPASKSPPATGEAAQSPPADDVKPLTHEQIADAAAKLGLKIEGKTDEELRAEIASRVYFNRAQPHSSKQEKAG